MEIRRKPTTITYAVVYGLGAVGIIIALIAVLAVVSPRHVAAAGECSIASYFPRFTTLVRNGTFATSPSDIYPSGSTGMSNTVPGHYYANAGFRSQMANRGHNQYPNDHRNGRQFQNVFSAQSGRFESIRRPELVPLFSDRIDQLPFPGDPTYGVPASNNWLYTNGNILNGREYLTWEQDVSGLRIGTEYVFVAYISSVIEPPYDAPDDPTIRFRVGGTTGMPDGTVIGGPTVLTEAATGNSRPLNGWQRVAFPFIATTTTQKFKVTDASPGTGGDDFGLTAIHISECVPTLDYNLITNPTVPRRYLPAGHTELTGSDRPTARVIHDAGPTESATPVNYGMSQFVVRAGQPFSRVGGEKDDWPSLPSDWASCAFPRLLTPTTDCREISRVTRTTPIAPSAVLDMPIPATVTLPDNLNLGDQVCWMSFVSTYRSDKQPHQFRYSEPVCLTVSKAPQIQFQGADVRSGNHVMTAPSTLSGATYGSWAEYAILAQQTVASSSGAGLSSGPGGRPAGLLGDTAAYNQLTFGNTAVPYGHYNSTIPASTIPTQFRAHAGTPTTDFSQLSTMNGTYSSSGNVTISGNHTIPPGSTIIIRAENSTVTINGNISYAEGPYTSISDLPQLVIIARNIAIGSHVTRVDAWLLANGAPDSYVTTCDTGFNQTDWLRNVNSSSCNGGGATLQVNGPTVASHVYLRRTHGAERGVQHIPAEIMNLRPDVYVWAYGYAHDAATIRTAYLREMPPRY